MELPSFRGKVTVAASLTHGRNGDRGTGKAVLRNSVNTTVGFQDLEERTQIPVKSLMRMLGPKGSPSAANLTSILTALQETAGAHFELALKR
jgi:DNA-binding phage protein